MNTNNSCPCCSNSMLLHLSNRRSYWFCSHCRLEMPNLVNNYHSSKKVVKQLHPNSLIEAIAPHQSSSSIAAI